MQPYNKLIMEALKGETPEGKYKYLRDMQQLLHKAAFPRRGKPEEKWEIMDVVKEINDKRLIELNGDYEY